MISVVIPLYNKEKSIAKSLRSVLSQSYEDFEVVVVDDGSTDGSVAIVEAVTDPRVRLIRQKNGGPSKARNAGVSHAKGGWVLFLDADDELLPGALAYFEDAIKRNPQADMLLGEVQINDGHSVRTAKRYKEGFVKNKFKAHALGNLYQCSGTTIYRKAVCRDCPFDERLRRYEDLQRIFELYRRCSLYLCPRPVAQVNAEYASASRARRDIKEDFLGYLDFKGKSFWEKMSLYALFLGEREHYGEQCRRLYPWLYGRYDRLLMYKVIHFLHRLGNKC